MIGCSASSRTTRSARASPACRRGDRVPERALHEHAARHPPHVSARVQGACSSCIGSRCRRSVRPERRSELGYMLDAEGASSPAAPSIAAAATSVMHAADFDFNLLPLRTTTTQPSRRRTRASSRRCNGRRRCSTGGSGRSTTRICATTWRDRPERQVWLLFDEANEKQPAHPGVSAAPHGRSTRATGSWTCTTSRRRAHRCTP